MTTQGAKSLTMFEIWSEGSSSFYAHFIGLAEGETFEAACKKYVTIHDQWQAVYDEVENMLLGCKLFDNESDARKTFG